MGSANNQKLTFNTYTTLFSIYEFEYHSYIFIPSCVLIYIFHLMGDRDFCLLFVKLIRHINKRNIFGRTVMYTECITKEIINLVPSWIANTFIYLEKYFIILAFMLIRYNALSMYRTLPLICWGTVSFKRFSISLVFIFKASTILAKASATASWEWRIFNRISLYDSLSKLELFRTKHSCWKTVPPSLPIA